MLFFFLIHIPLINHAKLHDEKIKLLGNQQEVVQSVQKEPLVQILFLRKP